MTRRALLAALLLALGALAACDDAPSSPGAQVEQDRAFAERFLVQHACANAAGVPRPGVIPLDPDCGALVPAREGYLAYRRFDWSVVQASDAVLRADGAIAQTFDFGDHPRAFGRLDRGLGDGGDLVVITRRGVGIQQTEDGGAGRQWWRDERCHEGDGWLLFRGEPGPDWTAEDGRLGRAFDPSSCASAFSAVHTRWRLAVMPLPWSDATGVVREVSRAAIVSEHFAGGPPAEADHMERFVFAEGLGKVAWERWEHIQRSRRDQAELVMAQRVMHGDRRCPVAEDPPAPGWVRADCRVWLRFERMPGASLPWP